MGELISGSRRIDLAEVQRKAAKAAAGLRSLGVKEGDVVALVLRNDFAFFEASFAAGLIGAYPTPVNWHATPAEALYLFNDSEAKAIVIHADLVPGLVEALPEDVPVLVVRTPPEIVEAYGLYADEAEEWDGCNDWDEWLEGFEPVTEGPAEPPGSIIYTSGTTGHPKGVKRAPPTTAEADATRRVIFSGMGFTPHLANPDKIVTVITGPMYHSAPNAYGLSAGRLGANIILQPRFDPEGLLQLIERHRVTHIHMVPIMFNRLVRLSDHVKQKYDLSSLEFVVHAAAPVSPPIKRQMIEWWGPVINEYYGSTETGLVVSCTSEEWLAHPGTVGKAIPEADVKVLGPDGQVLPPGEVGEVVARNRQIADFTYQGDDAKRRASERAGLLTPGDVGYFDADGFLYLCDRAKDMIISGGANIYPAEIEAELHKAPGVADCAVFGIPDEEYGEAVCAVVQPQPGQILDEAEIRRYLRSRIAGYKVPKRVLFAEDLPREDSGKIFKRKLREPFWEGMERRI